MKTRLLFVVLSLIGLVLMGCSAIRPSFNDSNQLFIERTIDEIGVGNEISTSIPQSAKVALVSIETENTPDRPIAAMIEDQLVESLILKGYTVVERDYDMLSRLDGESRNSNYSWIRKADSDESAVKTNLTAADYIISYRVLECGILYEPAQSKPGYHEREGLVRLNLRVHRKNGEIVLAKAMQGTKKDQIRSSFVQQLADFHYSFFPHEYPLQPKEIGEGVVELMTDETTNWYFYFAPNVGMGITQDVEAFAYGGTIGAGHSLAGRFGANFTGLADENHNVEIITFQYERPIMFNSVFGVVPKVGAGYGHVEYDEEKYGYYWSTYHDIEDAEGFCLVFGGEIEFDVTKNFLIKAGYEYIANTENHNGDLKMFLATFGFRL